MVLQYDTVIIGGVAAGTSAAAAIKRLKPNMSVAIFQKEPYISYGGCGLPYVLSGDVKNSDSVIALTPESFKEKKGADVFVNQEVTNIDFEEKKVIINSGEKEVFYNDLIISTGASPIMPKFEAINENGIFKLRNPDDTKNILKYIKENNSKKAVVIGAGYIGIETAEGLLEHNLDITVIEGTNNVLKGMDEEIKDIFIKKIKDSNIEIVFDTFVDNIKKENNFKVITKDKTYDADIVIVAVGVKPNTKFLENSNINMLKNGAILIDEYSKTNIENVYACGDCASVKDYISKKDIYIPLGTTANKQGRIAGKNIGGQNDKFEGVIGSLITKFKDLEYGKTGYNKSEAIDNGFDADDVFIKGGSRAGYYNGSKKIAMKLTFEKDTGRILGAQYVGGEIFARINPIVSMIYKNGTVNELRNMDMPYAPPFSPVWDINLVAANVAMKKL